MPVLFTVWDCLTYQLLVTLTDALIWRMRGLALDAASVPRNALLKLLPWPYLNHDRLLRNEGLDK
jgi:hypothetical protein